MKFRHEHKHYINYMDYVVLRSKLKAIMKQDDHTDTDGAYQIRSLYFDNFRDTVLNEKIDGINHREKFRIRCYNNDFSFVNLEKKTKINSLCSKILAPITQEEAESILDCNTEWMAESNYPLIVELYTKMKSQGLRPKSIVDYSREAYVFKTGNVRVTIDRNIRTGLLSTAMFNPNLPMITAGDSQILLEVKYDNFLPEIISNIVQLESRRQTAFSKYAASRIYG
ncbi:VTC domain-containing protein [Acetobacterium paludosum]|uniref:VTC domain-containing protein n=1 Tax=Acetobacterium paludosum TaxID=52693 RepID=A0A923HSZ9_9FIRM|nr:polyphosphate polymerase domain-containing protein [Acetobacterium paludosum]MBC3887776.1 VTC domain-containing protein [Acetobacterium paludosum]